MNFIEVGFKDVSWIVVSQDMIQFRDFVMLVMNRRIPLSYFLSMWHLGLLRELVLLFFSVRLCFLIRSELVGRISY